ncbi:UNVERIFIED_CONTAM: hypothetical protein K2H54_055671 [Gekko kuhli]
MSGEEEDQRLPGGPDVPVTTTLVITTPMEACTQCKEEKKSWEEHLAHMEQAQDQLIQMVDDTLMGIPDMVVQLLQAKIYLQQQQQQQQVPQQPPCPKTIKYWFRFQPRAQCLGSPLQHLECWKFYLRGYSM